MGAYLSKPMTDIETTFGTGNHYEYTSASMQGWRVRQEDAHVCLPDFDEQVRLSMFGVFDGHGGSEVSAYCAQKLAEHIKNDPNYRRKRTLEKALRSSFLSFDLKLLEKDVQAALKELTGPESQDSASDEEPEDINCMLEEATMPIEAIMAKYKKSLETGEGSSGQAFTWNDDDAEKSETDGPAKDEKGSSPEKNGKHEDTKEEPLNENSTKTDSETKAQENENSTKTDSETKAQEKSCEENGQAETKELKPDASSGALETNNDGGSSSATSPDKPCEKNGTTESENNSLEVKEKEKTGKSSGKTTGSEKAILQIRSSQRLRNTLCQILQNSMSTTSSDEDDSDSESCSESSGSGSSEPFNSGSDQESSSCSDDEHGTEENKGPKPYNEDLVGPALDSGTTAIVAIFDLFEVIVANVGDSRAILGYTAIPAGEPADSTTPVIQVRNLSSDHKPENPIEKARIEEAGGYVDGDGRVVGGLNLSRAFGDHSNKQRKDLPQKQQMISAEPDIISQSISIINANEDIGDKFLFLACDGIWNTLSSEQAAEFIWDRMKNEMHITDILKEMFNFCLAKDTAGDGTGCDNMTAILVHFKPTCSASSADTISNHSSDFDDDDFPKGRRYDSKYNEILSTDDAAIMPPPTKKVRQE